ncbi:MAG: pre-toxin TG domain-containing protein, partial [Actinomycetota bacterium]
MTGARTSARPGLWRRLRWVRMLASVSWLGFVLAVVLFDLSAAPVAADNCSVFTDCFGQSEAASEAALGLTFLAALSLVIDFIPIVGDVKGLIELGTGKDLLTGQELEPWERSLGLIGLIPGGDLLRLAKLGDAAAGAGGGLRAIDGAGDVGGFGRLDAPSGTPGPAVTAGGRGDGFDPFGVRAGDGPRPVEPVSPLPPLRPPGGAPSA